MIGYITVGTNDMPKAAAFYDALLADMGAKRMMEEESFIVWSNAPDKAAFSIAKPFDGNPATVGNGVMIALALESAEQVNAMHAKALSLGATDEGAPGPRGGGGFYASYFRDLDGNKINFFTMTQ
ncbi:VOC family protein [Alteromonadaceae bacterium BrNp21-10]|nr:VOC family protein [Alteromonadaceae bacterium BrNp21-10]